MRYLLLLGFLSMATACEEGKVLVTGTVQSTCCKVNDGELDCEVYGPSEFGFWQKPNNCPEGVITIPEGITSIGENAFRMCKNENWVGYPKLTSVVFPSTLNSIGPGAFSKTDLTSVDLSATKVTSIGRYAFSESDLNSVVFPAELTTIDYSAFSKTDLTSVDLSATKVTSIVDATFFKCTKLTSVDFPVLLDSIGQFAFDFTNLTSVDLSATKVTSIGQFAFEETDVTSVVFPSTLNSIGSGAFPDLTSVTYRGIKPDIANLPVCNAASCTETIINLPDLCGVVGGNNGCLVSNGGTLVVQADCGTSLESANRTQLEAQYSSFCTE